MELVIKGSDPESTLFGMMECHVINATHLEEMLNRYDKETPVKPQYPPVMDYDFETFVNICNAKNDAEMLWLWRRAVKLEGAYTVAECVAQMWFVLNELKNVKKAFEKARMPKLTEAEQLAGFGNVNFGFFGIVDTLACRQGVADDVILKMKLRNVIGKLSIMATRANCERRLSEIYKKRNK